MAEDAFALFGLEPSPGPDLEALKEQFTRVTAESHPDRFPGASETERQAAEARTAALNRAYQTLADPRQRLLLLYELASGTRPRDVQKIPPGTMDLFIEVGKTCQEADAFLQRRSEAGSALARAGLTSEQMALQETLLALGGKLATLAETLAGELAQLDAAWRASERNLAALETLYRKYSYLGRWRQQLEERELALLLDGEV